MCHIENKIFDTGPSINPTIYCRYVDDMFIIAENLSKILRLKQIFKKNCVLKFTYELETKKQLHFLDTLITRTKYKVTTSTFSKSTNNNGWVNFESLCPERYKITVVKLFT